MKSLIKKLVPNVVLESYRRNKRKKEKNANLQKTTEQVFTEIYASNKWGGGKGEFCSGSGSTDVDVVSRYVSMVESVASEKGFLGSSFVDLGCGDFRVGKQMLPFCSTYIGVDIVEPLVLANNEKYGNDKTSFVHLNIVEQELPDGDVCFVRQVLQHLSNEQIIAILQKLQKYKWVFITEHYPEDNEDIRLNLDKPHGADIRLYENSGVYLTKPPFNLPELAIEQVLEVAKAKNRDGDNLGIIRTFLYKTMEPANS